jgi:hypothetical protein
MMRYAIRIFAAVAVLALPLPALCAHEHVEKWYQQRWCAQNGGEEEVILADTTRIDCLTEKHAIEFDFGSKWAESLGQALHYGALTGKRAGIVLILENPGDKKFVGRLKETIDHFGLPVDVWTTGDEAEGR